MPIAREARGQPRDGLSTFISKMDFCATRVCDAYPGGFVPWGHFRDVCFALYLDGANVDHTCLQRQPNPQRLSGHNGFAVKCVQERKPLLCMDLLQRTRGRAQIAVQRCEVRAKVSAGAGGPHQQAQRGFELLAQNLLALLQFQKLLAELCHLFCGQVHCLLVELEGPAAPRDMCSQLCPAPGDRNSKNRKQCNDQARAVLQVRLAQEQKQVVHMEPCAAVGA